MSKVFSILLILCLSNAFFGSWNSFSYWCAPVLFLVSEIMLKESACSHQHRFRSCFCNVMVIFLFKTRFLLDFEACDSYKNGTFQKYPPNITSITNLPTRELWANLKDSILETSHLLGASLSCENSYSTLDLDLMLIPVDPGSMLEIVSQEVIDSRFLAVFGRVY